MEVPPTLRSANPTEPSETPAKGMKRVFNESKRGLRGFKRSPASSAPAAKMPRTNADPPNGALPNFEQPSASNHITDGHLNPLWDIDSLNNHPTQPFLLPVSPGGIPDAVATVTVAAAPSAKASGRPVRATRPTASKEFPRPQLPTKSKKAVPSGTTGTFSSIYRGVTKHRLTGRFEGHFWDANYKRERTVRIFIAVYIHLLVSLGSQWSSSCREKRCH